MRKRIRGVEPVVQQMAGCLRHEETPAEHLLWMALRDRQIDGIKFRRQQPIGQWILDFCASSCRLVIEVDGDIHLQQMERDKARTQYLEAHGYQVLRFRNEEIVNDLSAVLATIREAISTLKKRDT